MTLPYAGRCALVTGASAGIGAAFARELAARGAALVLTARRVGRLEQLAEELRQTHASRVECIAADLADPSSVAMLSTQIAGRGVAIDILVNNAGYGVPGNFLAPQWHVHEDFFRVLMIAPCELAYRLLPAMQQRGYGRILNIASLAGHVPGSAGHTLYGASKSFLIRFSQSLALENAASGVRVCAVCPGFTYSEFHDVTGTRGIVSKMPGWMWMDAGAVARTGLDACERGEIVYVTGRVNRVVKGLFKLLPDRFALRAMQRRSKHFRARQ